MTKSDCEKVIAEELRKIFAVYRRYNPDGNYLNLVVLEGNAIMFWDGDREINYYGNLMEV